MSNVVNCDKIYTLYTTFSYDLEYFYVIAAFYSLTQTETVRVLNLIFAVHMARHTYVLFTALQNTDSRVNSNNYCLRSVSLYSYSINKI